MANLVETQEQLKVIKEKPPFLRRFLYFSVPPELWLGAHQEGHADILTASNRQLKDVTVAGFIFYMDNLDIDGKGSETLKIERSDPTPVIEHVTSLPITK